MSKKGKLLLTSAILLFICYAGLFFALRTWMPFMWAIIVPAVGSLIGWLYLDRRTIFDFLGLKTTKHGLEMGAVLFLSLLFLAVLNFVGARHSKTFDFSTNQVNTLSEQSQKLVLNLKSDLYVRYFYKDGIEHVEDNKKLFRDLVKRYQDISAKVRFEFVEMNEKAKLTEEFGANKGAGEAFIEYNGNKNRLENITEQDFTNALIKVTRTAKKVIYFLEGHGERSLDDEKSERSVFGFKQLLEKNSYEVKKISLAGIARVPDDADVLIIVDPVQTFQDVEVKAIENYLVRGGAVFLAVDGKIPNGLNKITTQIGIETENFYVFNVFDTPMGPVVNAQSPTVAVQYSTSNSITKVFGPNQMTVFRQPHALKEVAHSDKIKVDFLVRTPDNSVALQTLDSEKYLGKPQSYQLAAEVRGIYSEPAKEFALVVFSDADFISNSLLYQNLNRDLALNSLATLSKDSDLVSITPKEIQVTKMTLSPPEFKQFFSFVVLGLFFPLPIIFMITSLVLWLRRRHA